MDTRLAASGEIADQTERRPAYVVLCFHRGPRPAAFVLLILPGLPDAPRHPKVAHGFSRAIAGLKACATTSGDGPGPRPHAVL